MVVAIRAGLVWDGTGSEPISNGVVLVDDDRITVVGAASDVEIPSGASVIERPGEFLMPGLINAHTHITIIPGLGNQSGQKRRPIERQALRGARNMRREL